MVALKRSQHPADAATLGRSSPASPAMADRRRDLSDTPSTLSAAPAWIADLADGSAVSGCVLAERMGVTRAAVWKQIQGLRALGLQVRAQTGRGYQLVAPVDLLDATAIRAALTPQTRARLGDLQVHWQLDSTSSELLRQLASDPRDRLVCVAEVQSHGRGRRGRAWQTPLGGGIALSLLKRFDGGMAALAGLSLAVGIALVAALEDCGVGEVGLKWPNDLVARGAKLGGILVELGGEAQGPCHAVIGIGLNLRLPAAYSSAVAQPCIDLATLANGAPPSRTRVVAHVLDRLVDALDRFAATGFAGFADAFARHDVLRNRRVRVLRGDAERDGIACGVDERGALRVAFAEGECVVDSGDVSVRESS